MGAPIRILHVHSTFSLGGKEARAVRLMNAFGDTARHTVLSAVPGALAAREAIAPGIAAEFPADHPPLIGKPGLARYRLLARYMRGFDLLLSYNWGAMDAVGARRLFGGPPLVHHEDGFNQDEVERQKPARVWFRRLMLPAAHRVVVPSARLEAIARASWAQPAERLVRIANGIPVARFALRPAADAIPGFQRRPGELIVGTMAGLRAVKNLPRLVRAFAAAGVDGRLVIIGEGPERATILAEAQQLGVADRVILPGFVPDPARFVGLFDIFALSSDSEQFPISLIEAMAASLPVASPAVGDVATMVSQPNRPFVTTPGDDAALAEAIRTLAVSAAVRERAGAANRARAVADYDEAAMIDRYGSLYAQAVGRPGAFTK